MLEGFPISFLVGSVLGTLSGLGVGGGSLLILWLTLVLGMDQAAARGINLIFFLPSALIVSCFRRKQGAVRWQVVIPAALAGCAAAAFGTWMGFQLDLGLLKKLFGGLLVITGLRELFYKPKDTKPD